MYMFDMFLLERFFFAITYVTVASWTYQANNVYSFSSYAVYFTKYQVIYFFYFWPVLLSGYYDILFFIIIALLFHTKVIMIK